MTLTKYKAKRNFKKSTEPAGGEADTDSDHLHFVIQKHDASHLHYDFRLEMGGVLKSWAVPKGPSTDPSVKRLAIMVEDHPYDYKDFEGIIPSGYGAGTVIVWDEGIYQIAGADGKDKKTQDKELRAGIHKGKLHFVLHGKKLKGEYALIKTQAQGKNSWLLFKIEDEYATREDVTLQDKSVVSNKTLDNVEKSATHFSKKKNKEKYPLPARKNGSIKLKEDEDSSDKHDQKTDGKLTEFPSKLSPMLATLVDKPFDKDGWQYEIKWDGYRAIAFCNKDQVELKSRNNKSFNEKFYPVYDAVHDWNISAVIDGEIVVLDESGKSNFGSLQNWRSEADGQIYYYVFDVLWQDGKSLIQLSLSERRKILKGIVPNDSIIRLSEDFQIPGTEFFETAKRMGLEGIMAKKSDSIYVPGIRSKEWLKIKANKNQEMIIGGYTKNDDSSKSFSSLLLGVFEGDKLIYTGKVGTGFNDKQQKEMLKQFEPYIINDPPFAKSPDINKPSRFRPDPPHAIAVWMKPELICEVSFTEMTSDGIMRHPSFEGMRMDKKAKEVTREKATDTKKIISNEESASSEILKPAEMKGRKTFLNPHEKTQVREINGHEIKFNNLDKIYWPKEKITKRDMLNYYYQMAPHILPYLIERPQSMNRHPNGIKGESFYFKDVTGTAPEWVETYKYKSPADNRVRHYLVAKDDASLLYMATLGCIEMNPWHSRVKTEDYPDWCIIDIDPADNSFEQVIETANVTKDILDNMGVASYPKTSGATGMHIYIPLGAKYTYEQSKEFARVVATLVQAETPKFTSIERIVKARKGKVYVDFLQNRPQATVAAPYSLRPKPGATVSMPLHWDEVKKGLKITDFTIYNALERIQSEGDIFKPVLGKGIDLETIVEKFGIEEHAV